MRNIGYMIVGGEFGIAFADWVIRGAGPWGKWADVRMAVMGFVIWTILIFGDRDAR